MKEKQTLSVGIKLRYVISLWAAIKLRVAGRNYQWLAEHIMEKMKDQEHALEKKAFTHAFNAGRLTERSREEAWETYEREET